VPDRLSRKLPWRLVARCTRGQRESAIMSTGHLGMSSVFQAKNAAKDTPICTRISRMDLGSADGPGLGHLWSLSRRSYSCLFSKMLIQHKHLFMSSQDALPRVSYGFFSITYTIAQNPDAGDITPPPQHHYHPHLPLVSMPLSEAPSSFPLSPQISLWTRLQVPTLP